MGVAAPHRDTRPHPYLSVLLPSGSVNQRIALVDIPPPDLSGCQSRVYFCDFFTQRCNNRIRGFEFPVVGNCRC